MTMQNSDSSSICHFFLQGKCRNGANCRFSHQLPNANATPGLICKFFQAGMCAYGDKCRYDHVKTGPAKPSPPGSTPALSSLAPRPPTDPEDALALSERLSQLKMTAEHQASVLRLLEEEGEPAGAEEEEEDEGGLTIIDDDDPQASFYASGPGFNRGGRAGPGPVMGGRGGPLPSPLGPLTGGGGAWMPLPVGSVAYAADNSWMPQLMPAVPARDKPLCLQFLVNGCCPEGDECRRVHGIECPVCRRHCLHPFRKEEHEEHIRECSERQGMAEARQWSSQFECGICLEHVISPEKQGAKFGLLSCSHSFCLDCIRQWRRKFGEGIDVDSALRACPICRQVSYFIVPSAIWPRTDEEKDEIINGYKDKLKSIDCRHYDFGRGTCPFGTSCFYRHADENGVEERTDLRKAIGSDGESLQILQAVRLSDFITTASEKKARGRRR